ERREYLRAHGVEHVFDSRTTEFAEEILARTEGRGVDLVLNSLVGEALTRSLEILAPYGRFLEIGRTAIYQNHSLGLFPFRRNLSYFAVDMNEVCRQRPDTVRGIMEALLAGIVEGRFQPLPTQRYAPEQAEAAFRSMMQRRHLGKVVLEWTAGGSEPLVDTGPVRHVLAECGSSASVEAPPLRLEEIRARCPERVTGEELYRLLDTVGGAYGPALRPVQSVLFSREECLAELRLPREAESAGYLLHPVLLDGALQSLAVLLDDPGLLPQDRQFFVPFALDAVRLHTAMPAMVYCYGRLGERAQPGRGSSARADLILTDAQGAVVATLDSIRFRVLPAAQAASESDPVPPEVTPIESCLAAQRWQPAESPTPRAAPDGHWVLLANQDVLAESLADRLRAAGARVTLVQPGAEFARVGDERFQLCPAAEAEYSRLFRELTEAVGPPTHVVHLWACTPPESEPDTPAELEGRLQRTGYSVLYLARALAAGFRTAVRLHVITAHGQ
ncbi:MAG: zinc-binding dehydrogenase, partial [Armatimonadetes bacterium]|nr:zinc-binding dehydrogenase [Armatimonadota bacterium]